MESSKTQLKIAAIGLLLMCVFDLITALAIDPASNNLVVNSVGVFLWIALEAWAFVSIFRISREGTLLRVGTVLAFVYVALCIVNRVWFLQSPKDITRFYLAYFPKEVFFAVAVALMLMGCRKNTWLKVVGWSSVAITALSFILNILQVGWFMGWSRFAVVMVLDLLFAAFVYFMSGVEKEDIAELARKGIGSSVAMAGFFLIATIMTAFGVEGLAFMKEIEYYISTEAHPLIYSLFTYISLAGVFLAMALICQLSSATSSAVSSFKEKHGTDFPGRVNVTMLSLGALFFFGGVIGLFIGVDQKKEMADGVLEALLNPICFNTKLAIALSGIGGVLLAFGWAMKAHGQIKAMRKVVPNAHTSSVSVSVVLLGILAGFAAVLFVYQLVEMISHEETGDGAFGNYYVYMVISSLLFAATCLLLLFVIVCRQKTDSLALQLQQPEPRNVETESVEEQ
ncbi:MAG: hypothetical protein IJ745_00500 [Bacteroidales bacterium]|nr:hypothetical protein [Bacteroidales bacterium]